MKDHQQHIINKVVVDVNTNTIKKAIAIKDTIDVFLKHEVFPELYGFLDGLGIDPRYHHQVHDLSIEVTDNGRDDTFSLKNKIISKLKGEIKKSLVQLGDLPLKSRTKGYPLKNRELENDIALRQKKSSLSGEKRQYEAFVHFLNTGRLPWFFRENEVLDLDMILGYLRKDSTILHSEMLFKNNSSHSRLIAQYSNKVEFIHVLLFKINKGIDTHAVDEVINTKSFKVFIHDLKYNNLYIKYLKELLKTSVTKNETRNLEAITQIIREVYKGGNYKKEFLAVANKTASHLCIVLNCDVRATVKSEGNIEIIVSHPDHKKDILKTPQPSTPLIDQDENRELEDVIDLGSSRDNTVITNNLGLAILHPFLKNLFTAVGYLDDSGAIRHKKIHHTVHLLHYLATARTLPYEHEVVFEKILCSFPAGMPVEREIRLSKKVKKEADALLLAVLQHWSALKSSSIDALRTEFLQRDGKVEILEDKIKVTVHRRAVDLLLEKLPWSIAILKPKWLKKSIYITW